MTTPMNVARWYLNVRNELRDSLNITYVVCIGYSG